MSVTLRDIADDCGLSYQTVSAVLGKRKHLFRSETRGKVVASVRRLGYRPNAAARAMRVGRFGSISLLLSTDLGRSALPPGLLAGLHARLAEHELDLVVTRVPDEKLIESGFLPRFLCEHTCDGLLINYTDRIPAQLVHRIEEDAIPSIWLNTKRPHDCVYPDDRQGGRLVTEALINAGHRKIAYADYSHGRNVIEPHYSSLDRETGYRDAMRDADLEPQICRPEHTLEGHERPAFTHGWLAANDRPTAVVCCSHGTAIPVAFAAGQRGITMPDDLAIGSIDDQTVDLMGYPFITGLVPQAAMGAAAVDALAQKIVRPDQALEPQPIPFTLNHFSQTEGRTSS